MKGFPRRKEGRIPRSVKRALNPGTRQGKRRARRILFSRLVSMSNFWKRDRGLSDYARLEKQFGFNILGFMKQKALSGKAVATEIGAGRANTLVALRDGFGKAKRNAVTFNIDVAGSRIFQALRGIRLLKGDALRIASKAKIPKSDLIISIWALEYIGHPDYMARKIAEALKPGGVAVLHFGIANPFSLESMELNNWSPYLDNLARGKEKLSGCEAKVYVVPEDDEYFMRGDYFVMLRKHPLAR